MGVIYIGDRLAGKTHLAMESCNPQGILVKGQEATYRRLRELFYDPIRDSTRATDADQSIHQQTLELEVQTRPDSKRIIVDWWDTPGEIWRENWQSHNQDEWKRFLKVSGSSEAIVLILPPHRGLNLNVDSNMEEAPGPFSTQKQWCNRFDEWVKFFAQDCPNSKHLLICLNKADLFCDVHEQAEKIGQKDWMDRHKYVYHHYFRPVHPQIDQINHHFSGLSARCFITSIKSRPLLELPWQYLGIYLKEQE